MSTLDLYARLQQGRLLDTPQTRRWSREEIVAGDVRERRAIFTGFSGLNQGRGRIHVARLTDAVSADTARRLVACWNASARIESEQLEQLDKIPPAKRIEALRQLINEELG